MTKAEETRRNKARQLRYKKPIAKDLNLWTIREELGEITEECENVRWYFDTEDDSLINALDGNEDEAYEFKMMFADLCAECEQMYEDLQERYVPEYFDILCVAAGAGDYAGGYLGWDSYEQDYYGLELSNEIIQDEGLQKIKQLTKEQLVETMAITLKILWAYLGLHYRYDSLKASMDILRDQNTGYLKMAKRINEIYDQEMDTWEWQRSEALEFERMLKALPPEAWIQ